MGGTNAHAPHSGRSDRGAVLPIVLVIVLALALAVVAIARYATASLSYSSVSEERAYRLTAADSALRNAVDQIRAGSAECLFTGQPVVLPTSATEFNGVDASVTCASLDGSLDAQQLWAVVLTAEGLAPWQNPLQTSGGSNDKVVEGRVWISRVDPTNDLVTGPSHQVEIQNGPLVYFDGSPSPCTSVPAASLSADIVFTPSVVYRPICTSVPWTDQPSFDDTPLSNDLKAMIGNPAFVDPPPDTTTYPNCHVFSPGLYTTIPNFTDDTYFRTGDYFFGAAEPDNTLEFRFVDARAGSIDPSLGITPEIDMSGSPCAPAIAADAGPDAGGRYGATFYLGDRSRITIDNNASLEIMPRPQFGTDRTDEGTVTRGAYVSVQALCDPSAHFDPDGDSWCDSTAQDGTLVTGLSANTLPAYVPSSGPGVNRSIIYTAAGANKELVTHGSIYVPTAHVRFANAAAPQTDVRILGGVTSARIDIQVEPSATNFRIGVDTLPVDVDLLLTSTAVLDGTSTEMQSVVEYRPVESAVVDRGVVHNWRVCGESGC